MKNNEIKEMIVSLAVILAIVFFAALPLTNFAAASKLAFFYAFLLYLPFLPLAYSFKETGDIEKAALAIIFGLGYAGIYAVLDVFLKIKLNMLTYLVTTIIILVLSSYFWINSKH
jgi:hypothetical protein